MKEVKLDFMNIISDNELITNTDFIKTHLEKYITNISLLNSYISNKIKNHSLSNYDFKLQLGLIEGYTREFLHSMEFDVVFSEDMERSNEKMKEIIGENRKLRTQLGDKVSNEDVREKIKNMETIFYEWWKINGCGHVSEFAIKIGYADIKLSGLIFNENLNKSFKLTNDNKFILANDDNINLLKNLLLNKFNNSEITNIETSSYNNELYIKEITLYIYDLNDIK